MLVPKSQRGQATYINKAAFASAPDTRRGTSGVGNVEGPGTQSFDFSLRKRFALTERVRLQVQADFFNAFNRTNFRDMDTGLATAPFGTSPSNLAFGTLTASGPARNIQLGMKLTF